MDGLNSSNNSHECIDCMEVISNPVCSFCLHEQMKEFVAEHDEALARTISPADVPGATSCLHCSRKMGLCAHCYSHDVYLQLAEANKELAQEFMARFDFELRDLLLTQQ